MRAKTRSSKLPEFFKPLFWSYKFSCVDPEKDKRIVIVNTINYGDWKHWMWMLKFYRKQGLKKTIEEIPGTEFRPPALKLISLLIGITKLDTVSKIHIHDNYFEISCFVDTYLDKINNQLNNDEKKHLSIQEICQVFH